MRRFHRSHIIADREATPGGSFLLSPPSVGRRTQVGIRQHRHGFRTAASDPSKSMAPPSGGHGTVGHLHHHCHLRRKMANGSTTSSSSSPGVGGYQTKFFAPPPIEQRSHSVHLVVAAAHGRATLIARLSTSSLPRGGELLISDIIAERRRCEVVHLVDVVVLQTGERPHYSVYSCPP